MLLALRNSLILAVLCTLVATPIGVALALGLTRWRGRGAGTSNGLMLLPLATPEIVMGSALFLVFTNLYTADPARSAGAAARSRDVLDLLRRGHRPRPDALHRPRVRDRRAGPRRLAGARAPNGAGAAAAAGRLRQRDDRVRRLARRLRGQLVPVRRRVVGDRADQALQRRTQRALAGPERPRHDHARRHRCWPCSSPGSCSAARPRARRCASSPRSTGQHRRRTSDRRRVGRRQTAAAWARRPSAPRWRRPCATRAGAGEPGGQHAP